MSKNTPLQISLIVLSRNFERKEIKLPCQRHNLLLIEISIIERGRLMSKNTSLQVSRILQTRIFYKKKEMKSHCQCDNLLLKEYLCQSNFQQQVLVFIVGFDFPFSQ